MIVSWVMSVLEIYVQLVAKFLQIVQLCNPVLETNVQILAVKNHVDQIPNVQSRIKKHNVPVCLDFCPTQLLSLDVQVHPQLVLQITNVQKDSNVMPSFADLSVILMMLVWPMNYVLTMFVRKFVNLTQTVKQLKFARELNVFQDVDLTQIALLNMLVIITNVLIPVPLLNVELMQCVLHKTINHSALVHQE
jgi:hypothetical protein